LAKVTIGITTYNRLELLKKTLETVTNQTFQEYRIIIGNDYPNNPITFKSLDIKPNKKIKIINNKKNLGEIKNSNNILKMTTTDWFCWLSDDDKFHPDFLNQMFKILEIIDDKNISAVYTNVNISSNIDIFNFNFELKEKFVLYKSKQFYREYLNKKINLIGCYGLMKTNYLKKIKGMISLAPKGNFYSDTLIPLMLIKYGKILYLKDQLIFNYNHPNSRSTLISPDDLYLAQIKFLKYMVNTMNELNFSISDIQLFIYFRRLFFSREYIYVLTNNLFSNFFKNFLFFLNYSNKWKKYRISSKYIIQYNVRIIFFIIKLMLKKILLTIKRRLA